MKLVSVLPISSPVKPSGFGRYVFWAVLSDYVAARALADYALKTVPPKTVAVFFNYDATQALIAALRQNPTRQGVQQARADTPFSAPGAAQPVRFLPSGDRNTGIQLVKVAPGKRSGTGFDFTPIDLN